MTLACPLLNLWPLIELESNCRCQHLMLDYRRGVAWTLLESVRGKKVVIGQKEYKKRKAARGEGADLLTQRQAPNDAGRDGGGRQQHKHGRRSHP